MSFTRSCMNWQHRYEGRISGTLQKEELSEELIMQFGMGMKKERTKEETEG